MKTRSSSQSSATLGVVYAVGAAIVFSTAGIIVRRIALPAWDVSFWRSILLVATILPLILLQWRRVLIDIRSAGSALVLSAFMLAGSFIAFILALGLAPVANVLIVFGATPFVTALLARLFLGEPIHRHTIAAMTAAVVGLGLSVAGSLKAGALLGMTVSAGVTLCMSFNYVIVRHRRDIGMVPALALAGAISAIVAFPFADPAAATGSDLAWLVALGPGQLAAGLLLYLASLKRIPAGRAALLGLLELVLGPIWVWAIEGERPSDLTLAGGAIVIGAAAANVWLDSRRPTG
ncbi:DMT family transporter [Reyranella sp.]|jgi:drug/metabolite transporter (DMT)-like permease|uniref:DMT family transporter n=1 Tax=Reyranella sp. TaxID=1929291 RepID=UPI002F930880